MADADQSHRGGGDNVAGSKTENHFHPKAESDEHPAKSVSLTAVAMVILVLAAGYGFAIERITERMFGSAQLEAVGYASTAFGVSVIFFLIAVFR